MNNDLTIGKLAKQSGVGVETVRFYEKKGLIQKPRRGLHGAFRTYSADDPMRIRFIKRAQDLGFTLREIKQLFDLNESKQGTCAEVKRRVDSKIEEVDAKISDLRKMKRSLQALSEACDQSKEAVACCRVMDCFE